MSDTNEPRSLEQQLENCRRLLRDADARAEQWRVMAGANEATIMAVVHTMGGTVEGAPTHRGNFLQRLRQLVDNEQAAK